MKAKAYAAIDLKSFYSSVECIERGLDPLATNLVVADKSRTEKTICLAVTPALKSYGIPGRARLFEVVQRVSMSGSLRSWRANEQREMRDNCWNIINQDRENIRTTFAAVDFRQMEGMRRGLQSMSHYCTLTLYFCDHE